MAKSDAGNQLSGWVQFESWLRSEQCEIIHAAGMQRKRSNSNTYLLVFVWSSERATCIHILSQYPKRLNVRNCLMSEFFFLPNRLISNGM